MDRAEQKLYWRKRYSLLSHTTMELWMYVDPLTSNATSLQTLNLTLEIPM